MIRVDRRLPLPLGFEEQARREFEEAKLAILERGVAPRDFFRRPQSPASLLKDTLFEIFRGKCAYCETPVNRKWARPPGPDDWMLDRFRPRYNARGHAESADVWRYRAHYWWLAWEWENLYVACRLCRLAKRTWFPVVGSRAKLGSDLAEEGYLLIDPCQDEPLAYLQFKEDGTVEARDPGFERARWRAERGATAIQILRLNRGRLRDARRRRLEEFREALERAEARPHRGRIDELAAFLAPEAPFAGACASCFRERATRVLPDVGRPRALEAAVAPTVESPERLARMEALEVASVPEVAGAHTFIESIRIENFRAIGSLRLELNAASDNVEDEVEKQTAPEDVDAERQEADAQRRGWQVLLGENGSGKSTMLQAVALALAGEERAHRLLALRGVRHRDLHRRAPRNEERPGPLLVELELSGPPGKIRYVLGGGKLRFEAGGEGVATVVRGYGTSRLPPRRRLDLPERPVAFSADNLFDPHATLIDAGAWLMAQDEPTFERAANALAELFLLRPGSVYRTRKEVRVRRGRHRTRLAELSDGYQALTGLVADLLAAVPGGFDDLHDETGIVLIDELGVHLHPKWRMSVVTGLRRAFPGFQFLATTHEPLCLRGLEDGEVGVMRRLPSGVAVLDLEVPRVAGLRVDQLLTSPHFGLSTTVDPKLDAEFEEYYDLLARRDRLGERNRRKLERLRKRLEEYRVLGYTRRDQLVYEILDLYLADEKVLDSEDRKKLKKETREKVLEVWRRVELADASR